MKQDYRIIEFVEGEYRWKGIFKVHYLNEKPYYHEELPEVVTWDSYEGDEKAISQIKLMAEAFNKPVLRGQDFVKEKA